MMRHDNQAILHHHRPNRKDFGIVYPGMTDDLIRDEVVIKFNLEAKPKS